MSRTTVIEHLVTSDDPVELSAIAQEFAADTVARLEEVVPKARRDNPAAIRSYVHSWRALESWALAAFCEASADFVIQTDEGVMLVDAKGAPSHQLTEVLDQEALAAPFSVWVQGLGEGSGIAVHLIGVLKVFRSPISQSSRRWHGSPTFWNRI